MVGTTPARPVMKRTPRQRVGRACDFCKQKKIRCSGERPCGLCLKDGRDCSYDAPYARGKNKRKKKRNTDNETVASPAVTSEATGAQSMLPGSMSCFDGSGEYSTAQSGSSSSLFGRDPARDHEPSTFPPATSRASLEPGESDSQGRFVGASSGLSLLMRLQRRLRQEVGNQAETSIFTLGDPVLPDFDESLFSWPSRVEADLLCVTYFDLSSPTYRFLHRPTVETWLREFYDQGRISEPYSHGKAAVLLSMFAQASGYMGVDKTSVPRSIQLFQAAERQINLQRGIPNIIHVQALLGCCFCTLSCSRLDHCWALFGTTARIILALGLHRCTPRHGSRFSAQTETDFLHLELRKRIFWCAYVLDKYLSAIFGRPCELNDDDTDQELPALVDDRNLSADTVGLATQDNMNIMLGPVCHQKLGRILSWTLKKLYGVKPLNRQAQLEAIFDLETRIRAWKEDLPAFLDPQKVDSRLLRPLFQRQSNLLTLACGHLEILIYRSCLLRDHRASYPEDTELVTNNIQRCLDAAMSIVSTVDIMAASEQFYRASWFTHYQAFCAVVILYTYSIKNRHKDPSTWLKYFQAAEKCHGMVAEVPGPESLAYRLILIMDEYRTEVVTRVHLDSPHAAADSQHTLVAANTARTGAPWSAAPKPYDLNFTELPDWEHLNSLLSL